MNALTKNAGGAGGCARRVMAACVLIQAGLVAFALLALGASGTYAQGSRKDDVVFNAQGRPMAGATVRVCTSAATG